MNTAAFKIALIKKNVRQYEVARILGLDHGYFSHVVNNRATPDRAEALAICKILGVSLKTLFPNKDDIKENKHRWKKKDYSRLDNMLKTS